MNFLTQRLVRLFYPYGAIRKVLKGPTKGQRFVVDPGMGFSYAMGVDKANLHFFQKHISTGAIIYDIGANRGQMALFFARMVGDQGCTVSIEPEPSVYEALTRNIELNGLTNVKTLCAAVDESNGISTFEFTKDYSTQGKLQAHEPLYKIPGALEQNVRTVTLDFLVEDGYPPPNILKVDVEGGAGGVLRGASRVLDNHGPKIYIELHGPEEQTAVRDELITRGYLVHDLYGRRILDPTAKWYSPLWCHRD